MLQSKLHWGAASLFVLSLSCAAFAQVDRQTSAGDADQLALDLIKSRSAAERTELLAAKKESITPALRRELVRQANLLLLEGKYSPALDIYQLAQNISIRISDKEGIAATSLDIGTVYYFQSNYSLALEQYQRAQALFSEVGNRTESAQALLGIALVYNEQRKPNDALQAFQRALKEFEALGNRAEIAKTLSSMGATYYAQGDYAAATTAFLKTAELNDSSDNLLQIANAFYMQREYEQALDYYAKSLKRYEAERNTAGIVSALASAANSYYYLGKYDQALEYYQKSVALDETLGDKAGMAAGLQGIGNVYRTRGDFGSALTSYLRSLSLAERSTPKVSTATTLGSIGIIRSVQGDNIQALSYFTKSLAQFETSGDKVGMARLLSCIGNVKYVQGNYPAALEAYQQGLALRTAVGDQSNAANLLGAIGTTHIAEKKFAEAISSYEKALAVSESLDDKPAVAATLTGIANAYLLLRDYGRALTLSERAVALARKSESPVTLWNALLESGKAKRALHQSAQASQSFAEAITIVESLRSQPPVAELESEPSAVPAYLAFVDFLIEQNRVDEALDYADRAKLQALSELMRNGNAKIVGDMSAQEQEAETKLTNEAAALSIQLDRETTNGHSDATRLRLIQNRLNQVRTNYVRFRERLYAARPQLKVYRGEPLALKLAEAERLITDDHTALLEFAITDENVYLFALTREPGAGRTGRSGKSRTGAAASAVTLKSYSLNTTNAELVRRVTEFRNSVARRDDSFQQQARDLYELLLKPALEQLARKTALVIVPDGILWGLPFEALKPAADQYLIEQFNTAYAPSLAAWRELRKTGERRATLRGTIPVLLGFANPLLTNDFVQRVQVTYGGPGPAPAPEQETEVQRLRTIYGAAHSRLYTGANASEVRLKTEKDYRVLHFAAHSLLDDTSPMYSFIALSGDATKQDDGQLHVAEIFGLHSEAELVVMSAIAMARGQVAVGNASLGLTWAWYVAGVPATVQTRWEVQAPGATELMAEFHGRLRARRAGISKAEALRQAELKLIHETESKHPYYWSGFMLIGDGR
jgi:CHAT domain-containing protein/uncharacterized protein HemY